MARSPAPRAAGTVTGVTDDRCNASQGSRQGAIVRVEGERETVRGWAFDVSVLRPGEQPTRHDIRLSWVDHDRWSGGRVPPSRTVEALVLTLEDAGAPPELPESFDAATARRWLPTLDDELPSRI